MKEAQDVFPPAFGFGPGQLPGCAEWRRAWPLNLLVHKGTGSRAPPCRAGRTGGAPLLPVNFGIILMVSFYGRLSPAGFREQQASNCTIAGLGGGRRYRPSMDERGYAPDLDGSWSRGDAGVCGLADLIDLDEA
jgi:hypothetical protein